jgi:organic radical activating enzyme
MKINEIFYSLQGEGYRAGQPTVFIRLAGCDLACGFCDTEFESGLEMTDDALLKEVSNYPAEWVTWTGGEPMMQLMEETVRKFKEAGFKQSIETNGNHKVSFQDELDWVVCSPKVAEHVVARNFPDGLDELRYAWHRTKKSVPKPGAKASHKYLSPICDGNNINDLNVQYCIELCKQNPEWKLSIQLHKLWNIL